VSAHTDLGGQWLPPGTDAEDYPAGCQVVERRERGGQASRVAGPTVDDARADPDGLGASGEGGHGDHGVANQTGISLPDRFEAPLLGVLDVADGVRNRMGVL